MPRLRPGPLGGLVAVLLAMGTCLATAPALAAPATDLLRRPGLVVAPQPGAAALPPKLTALSWVLADATTGDVLAATNAHLRLPPASTLKILTALTLLPRLEPEAVYRARFEDASVEGSKVGIVPGATYSVHSLFEGLFVRSGNDAANALSNAAGGVATTVAHMNETAHALGALDTTAVNPSGLDADGQFSSAYDLAVLGRAAMARADFRRYAATVRTRFPGKMAARGKRRASFEIVTQNRLLLNYAGAIGVKTGFTTLARGTFVGAAVRGPRTLVASVMHTGPGAWKESAALLDWGFANASRVRPVGDLDGLPLPSAAPAPLDGPTPSAVAEPLPDDRSGPGGALGSTPAGRRPATLSLVAGAGLAAALLSIGATAVRRRRSHRVG